MLLNMQHLIAHARGHEQAHAISSSANQQERKFQWLATTLCRACFVTVRQADVAQASARSLLTFVPLNLPDLVESARQVSWATTIRAGRVATLLTDIATGTPAPSSALFAVTETKWWIDYRDLNAAVLDAEAVRSQRRERGNQPKAMSIACAA